MHVLAALSCIDHLTAFDDDTPCNLIRAVRPDVFVKGGDYTRERLPEAALVEQLGGEVHLLPYLEDRSTTGLIAKNTGPVHIAAAVGTPVVELYALTNPQHTPWAVPHRVLSHHVACKYCYKSICPEGHHDCLRRIPPADVVAAARSLLHENLQEPEPVTIEEKAPCTPWASMPLSMIRPPV